MTVQDAIRAADDVLPEEASNPERFDQLQRKASELLALPES